MVTVLNLALFAAVLAFHTVVAAVMTRFFRVRLKTEWGTTVYAVVLIPIVLVVLTLVSAGVLGIGPNLGSAPVVLAVMVGAPAALGATIDVLYMEPPEQYELPRTRG